MKSYNEGSVVMGYTLVRPIGEGSIARVYLGVNEKVGKQLAFKFPRDNCEGFIKTEVEHLGKLGQQAHILQMEDCSTIDGDVWIAFPYVEHSDGVHNVKEYMDKHGAFRAAQAVSVAKQALEALVCAHEKGIWHRDIKPNNLLVDSALRVYVTDFNLASDQAYKDLEFSRSSRGGGSSRYCSPEQEGSGGMVDQRTDVYSTGLTLLTMLTDSFWRGPVSNSPKWGTVPSGLQALLEQALEYTHSKRLATVKEFLAGLNALPYYYTDKARKLIDASAAKIGGVVTKGGEDMLSPEEIASVVAERGKLYDGLRKLGEPEPVAEVERTIDERRARDDTIVQKYYDEALPADVRGKAEDDVVAHLSKLPTEEIKKRKERLEALGRSAAAWGKLRVEG